MSRQPKAGGFLLDAQWQSTVTNSGKVVAIIAS
jgi:hypothetical protein